MVTQSKVQVGIERLDLRIALAAVTLAFYIATFLPLYDVLGPGIVSLSSVPVALIGWLFGLRAGLLFGVGSFVLNAILLGVVEPSDIQSAVWGGAVAGSAALMVGAVAGTLRDIADRLSREVAARQAEEKAHAPIEIDLDELVRTAPAALMVVAHDGTLLFSNQDIGGMDAAAVRGRKVLDFVPQEHHEMFGAALDRVFRTGQVSGYQVADTSSSTPTLHVIRFAPVTREGRTVAAALLNIDVSDGE